MANRQYKDSVFRKLFHNKRELASLYQAIRPEDEILAKDIKLTTLRNVFLDSQRNDLSFLWKQRVVVLMEHQSTWNENIPLRMLPYVDHVYSKIIILVHVIDISYNEKNEILKSCEPLYGYSYLVHRVQIHQKDGDDDDTAIARAIDDCKKAGILTNFLAKNGKEVIDMFRLQWNIKDAKKYWKEEAHEDGKVEGKAESARSLMKKLHCTKEKAMELLDIPADLQPKIMALL